MPRLLLIMRAYLISIWNIGNTITSLQKDIPVRYREGFLVQPPSNVYYVILNTFPMGHGPVPFDYLKSRI